MSFPFGWTKRASITIAAAKVGSGGVSDFPVTLTESTLPSGIFTYARSDGGDVRFSTDAYGLTRLPADIIKWDTGTSKAIVRVRMDLSSAASNTFYVWYGNPSATLPANTDTYGRYAAYDDDFGGYWPMGDVSGFDGSTLVDRTSNLRIGAPAGLDATNLADAKIGKGLNLNGTNEYIVCPGTDLPAATDQRTIIATINADTIDSAQRLWFGRGAASGNGLIFNLGVVDVSATKYVQFLHGGGNIRYPGITVGAFYRVAIVVPSGADTTDDVQCYVNAVLKSGTRNGGSDQTLGVAAYDFSIGSNWPGGTGPATNWFDGIIDEFEYHTTARSAAWLTTDYNMVSDVANFAVAGSAENVSLITPQMFAQVATVNNLTLTGVPW